MIQMTDIRVANAACQVAYARPRRALVALGCADLRDPLHQMAVRVYFVPGNNTLSIIVTRLPFAPITVSFCCTC